MDKKEHVLIIEDDVSIAALQKDYLELSDIEVSVCHDGLAGYQEAINGTYDLVIVDVMLPSMDGFTISRKIREVSQIPIIIISAKKEDHDKIKGLKIGIDDYMIKPFSPSEMVARVQAHLHRYRTLTNQNDSMRLISNGIELDTISHRVWILEQEVSFPTKEYELLLLMMKNPNRVWSKEQLFRQVWGMDDMDTDVYTVIVHIARIRDKLKKAKISISPIETIWGSGYRYNVSK